MDIKAAVGAALFARRATTAVSRALIRAEQVPSTWFPPVVEVVAAAAVVVLSTGWRDWRGALTTAAAAWGAAQLMGEVSSTLVVTGDEKIVQLAAWRRDAARNGLR